MGGPLIPCPSEGSTTLGNGRVTLHYTTQTRYLLHLSHLAHRPPASSSLSLTTAKDSVIPSTSSPSAFSCLSLKEINQALWVTIGDCADDEEKKGGGGGEVDEEKGEESKVDWSKLRTMLRKAGDCAPQALATANSTPLTISIFPLLPLLTLLLLLITLRG